MSDSQTLEEPLDLLQAARDELIEGLHFSSLAPQSQEPPDQWKAPQPWPCRRCDTAHREVVLQSEVLLVNPAAVRQRPKPR